MSEQFIEVRLKWVEAMRGLIDAMNEIASYPGYREPSATTALRARARKALDDVYWQNGLGLRWRCETCGRAGTRYAAVLGPTGTYFCEDHVPPGEHTIPATRPAPSAAKAQPPALASAIVLANITKMLLETTSAIALDIEDPTSRARRGLEEVYAYLKSREPGATEEGR